MEVSIPNYEKYNPRNDRSNHVWFRMQNTFFTDQAVFSLSGDQQRLLLFVLCEASKINKPTVTLNSDYIAAFLKIDEEQLLNDFNALVSSGLVTANANHLPTKRQPKAVMKPTKRRRTDGQTPTICQPTNNTNKQYKQTNNTNKEEVSIEQTPAALCSDASYPDFVDSVCLEFLERAEIKPDTVRLWVETYGDPGWLRQEILKMIGWLDANPKKRPKKNYATFMGSWLSRGWEWHRKNLPSNPAKEKSFAEYLAEQEVRGDTGVLRVADGAT